MAGAEEVVLESAKSGGGLFVPTPSKIALYITLVIFLVFATVGTIESFQQKSFYPFVDNTLFRVASADHKLSNLVDSIESKERPTFDGFFAKTFPSFFWFWLKFWLQALSNLYFIIFLLWFIYFIFSLQDDGLIARNIISAIGIFVAIQFLFGLLLFGMNIQEHYDSVTYQNETYVKVPAKLSYFNDAMAHSIPFEGTWKFFSHWITKDLFYKIQAVANTDIAQAITNIPDNGTMLNSTGG